MNEPMSAAQVEAARERALDPTIDAGKLAFDVLRLADEADRLRQIVAHASAVAQRRVIDDDVAERLAAILDGQPDPAARKARR